MKEIRCRTQAACVADQQIGRAAKAVFSGRLLSAALAFTVGLLLSSFGALGAKWWREVNGSSQA